MQYGELMRDKLSDSFGYRVTLARDPIEAAACMSRDQFDVVVVDVLYRALSESYNKKRESARTSLTELEPYNLSGLAVLLEASAQSTPPALAIWTSGDANRALHMVLAHQEFGVRVFCSKESRFENLRRAIESAASHVEFVDVTLRPFLPRQGLPPIQDVLFREIKWRAIWRALAAGSQAHLTTAKMTNYDQQTIRKSMSPMAHQVAILNPRLNPDKQPFNILSSYATYHWEFFLDQAVLRMYPHVTVKK